MVKVTTKQVSIILIHHATDNKIEIIVTKKILIPV